MGQCEHKQIASENLIISKKLPFALTDIYFQVLLIICHNTKWNTGIISVWWASCKVYVPSRMEINADTQACLLPHPSHLQTGVLRGSLAMWLDILHPLESKLSSVLPAWNDPFHIVPHNHPPSELVHIILCVYALAQMLVISPFHIFCLFFPLH